MLTPFEMTALLLSLRVSFVAVIITLPLALIIAKVLSIPWKGRTLLVTFVHLPLVIPPVATGFLLLSFLGRQSFLGHFFEQTFGITLAFTWKGAAIASAVMAFPLMVRALRLSFENLDKDLYQVAQTLGASRFRIFRTLTLPLIMPGLITATILGFCRALGEFGATITFAANIPGQTQTLPLALYNSLQIPGQETVSMRLTCISIMIAFIALVGSEWLARRTSAYRHSS